MIQHTCDYNNNNNILTKFLLHKIFIVPNYIVYIIFVVNTIYIAYCVIYIVNIVFIAYNL